MSYYDDYIADGLCCESCGGYMDGNTPGFSRVCVGCQKAAERLAKPRKSKARS
jgi:hypothetical protein